MMCGGDDDSSSSSDSESGGTDKEIVAPIVYSSSDEEIEFDVRTEAGKEAKRKYDESTKRKKDIREKLREERKMKGSNSVPSSSEAPSPQLTTSQRMAKMSKTTTTTTTMTKTRAKGLGSLSGMGFSTSAQPTSPTSKIGSKSSDDDLDFGITYKPVKKAYSLPSGPSFADEAEFEREIDTDIFESSSGRDHGNNGDYDDDDEFGFDGNDIGDPIPRIDEVKLTEENEESINGIIEGMKKEVREEQLKKEGTETKKSRRSESQEALEKIQGRIGYTDEELREIEESAGKSAETLTSIVQQQRRGSLLNEVVMEEDEEEEEEKGVDRDGIITSVVTRGKTNEELEWDNIGEQALEVATSTTEFGVDNKPLERIDEKSKNIKSKEFFKFISDAVRQNVQHVDGYAKTITPTEFDLPPSTSFFANFFGNKFCFATPKLKISEGERRRDEVFYIANIKYDCEVVEHKRIIQTIYKRLTGNTRLYVSDRGTHWNLIGFQVRRTCEGLANTVVT